MRSLWGAGNKLEETILNLISGKQEDEIKMPPFYAELEDYLWKFEGASSPKSIPSCDKDELLIVVKGLLAHIRQLNDDIAVIDHAKNALVQLLTDKDKVDNGKHTGEHTGGS